MCGIAGFAAHPLPPGAVESVRGMMNALARRGPDGEGLERWPNAVLGHRRLAIFDLSEAGHQPMLTGDRQIGVVFNGAIYNFLEIRRDLEALGCRFRSQCDTEVLTHGYRQWGIDKLVARMQGIFAIAIWDNPARKLTLVRDRLGVKPLVYAVRNGQIAFASTVRAVAETGLAGEVDPDAVLEFLEFGWVSDDRTIYQGVQKLPAATILEWRDGNTNQREYWAPPAEPAHSGVSFSDAVEHTEELLLDAVKVRLAADVPVGALLSGGIDSSLVCWAMAKLNANVKCFTVGTPGNSADESDAARATAKQIGVPHEVIELSEGDQPELSDLINAYGEPFACSSALGMLRVCKAVKPQATVLLTGDGGDDIFLGYTHHRNFWRAHQLAQRLPAPAATLWPVIRPLVAHVPALRRPTHLLDYATGGLGAAIRTHDGLPYYQDANLLAGRLRSRNLSYREIPLAFESARKLLPRFLDYERRTRFVAEYMTKVDGASMYWAIEARSPFLDYRIWDYAAALPYATRFHDGELKAILRALVRKNIGGEVATRRKQGFTIPVQSWLATSWRRQLSDLLDGSHLERDGWVQAEPLRSAVDRALAQGTVPNQLWYLIVLEHWMGAQHQSSPLAVS